MEFGRRPLATREDILAVRVVSMNKRPVSRERLAFARVISRDASDCRQGRFSPTRGASSVSRGAIGPFRAESRSHQVAYKRIEERENMHWKPHFSDLLPLSTFLPLLSSLSPPSL